jgi:hypothetical protein
MMNGYSGLVISGLVGHGGLDTLIRAAFLRPVQIMRQTIPNHETQISRISAYHENNGLSRALKNQGIKRITHIPGRITNPIVGYAGYAGHIGLKVL